MLSKSQFDYNPADISPEFGTKPIPEGMVRFHHYTRSAENLPSIRQHGLLESHAQESYARGSTESPETFATAGAPNQEFKRNMNFVEGYVNPKRGGQLNVGENFLERDPKEHVAHLEGNRSTITMRGDIPARQIIATHEPWHDIARYMAHEDVGRATDPIEPYASGSMRSQVVRGEHDSLQEGQFAPTYGKAVKATKVTNAATVMLGGKL